MEQSEKETAEKAEEKKGKTFEEKAAEVEAAESAVKTDGTDDDIVFSPEKIQYRHQSHQF